MSKPLVVTSMLFYAYMSKTLYSAKIKVTSLFSIVHPQTPHIHCLTSETQTVSLYLFLFDEFMSQG